MENDDPNQLLDDGLAPGGDYNLLPYPSLPYAYSQPVHLAALAALHGCAAPPADRARVLELGCAAGGNIIPLAARFPNSNFVGIDLSQRHIDDGCQRIAALALPNIELHQGDLLDISFPANSFDYVICHGVFSWVPKAAQDAILRICGEAMAPNGMATISYNVLPGWYLRRAVRDLCRRYGGDDGVPQQRVAKARQALESIAQSARAGDPYGLLLRNEAKRLAGRPSSYLLGEYLVEDNWPIYFSDFVDHARSYNLRYLCEGDLSAATPEVLKPELNNRIKALAGSDGVAFQQAADFCTGRTFRCSVLIREKQIGSTEPVANPEQLVALHLASELQSDEERSNGQLSVYKDRRGRAIKAQDGAVRYALARLAANFPSTTGLAQLIPRDAQGQPVGGEEAMARICKALYLLLLTGQVQAAALPLQTGRTNSERPCAWRVARLEASVKQPWLTTLRHTAVPLHPVMAPVIAQMDGSQDRQTLRRQFVDALCRRDVQIPELPADPAQWDAENVATLAAKYVERTISYCAAQGILEAPAAT